MSKVTHIPFDDVFYFAEREFGIGWNDSNDLFFNNAFTYREIDYFEVEDHYLDLTKKEINELPNLQKANAITSMYIDSLGIKGDVYIDSK